MTTSNLIHIHGGPTFTEFTGTGENQISVGRDSVGNVIVTENIYEKNGSVKDTNVHTFPPGTTYSIYRNREHYGPTHRYGVDRSTIFTGFFSALFLVGLLVGPFLILAFIEDPQKTLELLWHIFSKFIEVLSTVLKDLKDPI